MLKKYSENVKILTKWKNILDFLLILMYNNIVYLGERGDTMDNENILNDYIVIKALEDGVTIMGLTRGANTRFHHIEKLDKGEVYVAQFTETTSAVKIKGDAKVYTKHGEVNSGRD